MLVVELVETLLIKVFVDLVGSVSSAMDCAMSSRRRTRPGNGYSVHDVFLRYTGVQPEIAWRRVRQEQSTVTVDQKPVPTKGLGLLEMKLVTAVVKQLALDDIKTNLLRTEGVSWIAVSAVHVYEPQNGRAQFYRGVQYPTDIAPKVRFEVLVDDACVDEAVASITQAARFAENRDGELWICEVRTANHCPQRNM
ncbi:P-II family nitrogen regulator [Mycobacterium kansasii]|uniref:Nitrogen regulatory P-II domain protein n=3 Tax=Mycobacterium kansasii TaxID=1768 RepID=A0A1V3XY59_MYCKA|nr:P-II family nitrogen regulator [Mycobacterium kansasii]AGZ52979.1 nitrogen regulatory protein P-II 1 [Mycobacterium kansasii ATCC 12478]KZS79557.1 hypothetical protein A4G30_22505 [Mycobacterium kansasii]MXO35719.1 hypothetical protein [Mycobacterium kansasii]OOK84135.1 nitrogen regulatory P-II domain protein [Mycobacterium kansasii]POX70294.1 hypothetical protein C3471_24845 [Mycobacterium kansasii]